MIGKHRAFETFEPRGEIAVAQRPNQPGKLVHDPITGEKTEIVMEKDKAFNFAAKIRQQVNRLGLVSPPDFSKADPGAKRCC